MPPSKKAKAADSSAAAIEYEVLSPIHHDGDRYEIGETIELDQLQAAPLLQANAVKSLAKKAAASAASTTTDKPTEGTAPPSA